VATRACTACGGPLPDGEGFVFCAGCSTPAFFGDASSPFTALGAPKRFDVDEKALEERYYGLSRLLHPDRFAASGRAALAGSMEFSAILNQAYQALRSPDERLESLLRDAGAIPKGDEARAGDSGRPPEELAEEFFEIQEAVMEDAPDARARLAGFREKIEDKSAALTREMYELARATYWEKPGAAAEPQVRKIVERRRERSYLHSMLANLEKLEGRQ
jgi:molecular chaperone HscB